MQHLSSVQTVNFVLDNHKGQLKIIAEDPMSTPFWTLEKLKNICPQMNANERGYLKNKLFTDW